MKVNYSIFNTLIIIVLSLSCQSNIEKNDSIEGIWQSIGYGRILKIDSLSYTLFDISKSACSPNKEGKTSDFNDVISQKNDTLSIKRGISVYYYKRLKELPELCNNIAQVNYDLIHNFEVFVNTFKEHYAYADLNNIDWELFNQKFRNKITKQTTEAEFYLTMNEMISELHDNHGSIDPTDQIYEEAELLTSLTNPENQDNNLKEYGDFAIAQLVTDNFLDENLTKDSWLLNWGKTKDNIGYIQVKAMMLYGDLDLSEELVEEHGFVQTYFDAFESLSGKEQIKVEVNGVKKIMNNVITDLKDTDYIILDARFNGGGNDEISLEILRHFNPTKKQVASKKARFRENFTKTTSIYLNASNNAYTKPVYLLTSQQTASAGDMLALCSLELNNIKRIGSHTQGAVSDALQKKLPNGWDFTLSNEVYSDLKGNVYENIGIPVDYELNYPYDRQTFFRSVAKNLEGDKQLILKAISKMSKN